MKTITLLTFGTKFNPGEAGGRPLSAGTFIDCRDLPNPHNIRAYRDWPGTDTRIMGYVAQAGGWMDKLEAIRAAINATPDGGTVAIACTGGKHRSVAMAEWAKKLNEDDAVTLVTDHTALPLHTVIPNR